MKHYPYLQSVPTSSFRWSCLALALLISSIAPSRADEPPAKGRDFALEGEPLTPTPARAGELVVYHDQLKPAAKEDANVWSENGTITLPDGGSGFRGPFQAQPVALSLNRLPEHAWLRLRFKLYVVGSWDGSNRVWGPDLWSLQVRGAQRLFFTTFCNMGDFSNNNAQSYPDEYPWGGQKAWTGAAGKNSLHFPSGKSPTTNGDNLNDGVYPIEVVFPHSGGSLILDFAGIYNDPPNEKQSWGVGDLEVVAMGAPPAVADGELPGLWDDLASGDPMRANTALWKMVTAGDRANTFITGKVAELEAEVNDHKRGTPPVTGLEALRLHRAHRIIRLLGIQGANPCFRIDHLVPEYFRDLNEMLTGERVP
jgi:hypothetical protein